jgi:hypothetical protein
MGRFSALFALSAVASVFASPVESAAELVKRATGPNYNQNYIAGGANVQYSPNLNAGSYTVTWNTNGDFVVGLGWTKGDNTVRRSAFQ